MQTASHMVSAFVNNQKVDFDYVLNNRDRVNILVDENVFSPNEEWVDIAQTSYAKKLIKLQNKTTD